MPVVHVNWWKGRTVEQKAKLIELVTKAFEEVGVNPSTLHIIIHDIPKTDWGIMGKPASELVP